MNYTRSNIFIAGSVHQSHSHLDLAAQIFHSDCQAFEFDEPNKRLPSYLIASAPINKWAFLNIGCSESLAKKFAAYLSFVGISIRLTTDRANCF